jgi:hypothetical protein
LFCDPLNRIVSIAALLSTENENVAFGVKASSRVNIYDGIPTWAPLGWIRRLELFKTAQGGLWYAQPGKAGCLMMAFKLEKCQF